MPLTQERAEFRTAHILKSSISYTFLITVEAGTHYSGVAELNFSLQKIPDQLPIDFQIQKINKFIVNGKETSLTSEEGFILIKGELLK